MLQVDYISARKALIPQQKSSPFDLDLGWMVDVEKENFVGRKALLAEKSKGSRWSMVGVEVDWPSLEAAFGRNDLVHQVAGRASRTAVPIYRGNSQIGEATSHTFPPNFKEVHRPANRRATGDCAWDSGRDRSKGRILTSESAG